MSAVSSMKRLVLVLASFCLTWLATAQDASPIDEVIYGVIEEAGIENAVQTYQDLRRSQADAYDFGPSPLNRLGYRLINEGRLDDAVQVFLLNIDTHPHVANGYDSLAEAYLWRGEYEHAAAAYEHLLEVAPRDTVASPGLLNTLTERATYVIEAYRRVRRSEEGRQTEVNLQSPRLQTLYAAVQEGGEAVVRAFREECETVGGPLVEPIEGDPEHWLVTFIWFEKEKLDHVVIESWLEGRSIEKRVMHKLQGTSIWFKSYRVPAGLRMGYVLSPNDRRLSPYSALLTNSMVQSTWTLDPLNPKHERGEGNRLWSVLELPGSASASWLRSDRQIPENRLIELGIESEHLGETWEVVVYTPPGFNQNPQTTYPLLVFFDGFGFANVDKIYLLLEELITNGDLSPVVATFVYNPGATRNRDMSCYAPTHAFLKEELLPRLQEGFRSGMDPSQTVIVGRSRSGLGAVCAAFRLPEVFGKALSQSGSFWWSPEGEEPSSTWRQACSKTNRIQAQGSVCSP